MLLFEWYPTGLENVSCGVCVYVDIMQLQICLCHFLCHIILLHPPNNIVRCDLCLMVWFLSADVVSLFVIVINLLLCLFMFTCVSCCATTVPC